MNILVVSNMGPKESNPTLGLFVDNQVAFLKKEITSLSYFNMSWNGDSMLHKLFKYPYFFMRFFFKYVFNVKKYDIIHVHYYYPTIIAAFIYKLFRNNSVKVIVTCHGGDIYCYSPPKSLYKRLSRLVDHWIFTSAALKQRFFKPVENASIICAGYNDKVYQYDDTTHKHIDCLLVGSLDFNKGIDRVIALINKYPTLSFAVVGSGIYSGQLKELERKVNNLTYYGTLKPVQLKSIISASHLLISLSRNESFGLVIAEANALGVPCIATKTDGALAQVHDESFLVEQNNVDEPKIIEHLYQSIMSYLSLPSEHKNQIRLELSKNARVYSLSHVSSEIIACYKKLLRHSNVK